MIASFFIAFREALEAALIVGIVLGYLARTGQTRYRRVVYLALGAAVAASLAGAVLFNTLAGGFTGRAEQIFEGATMLLGAALLTTMILWMMRQRGLASELSERVATEVARAHRWGLFSLVFVSVLREGLETVIFLGAASLAAGSSLFGALAGLLCAGFLGYFVFTGSRRLELKRFFSVTSILLILFAAGLVAQGVHELQEGGILPVLVEHLWDINPPLNADGGYPPWHENGYVGSILKSLLGYNGNPSLLEVASYLVYLSLAIALWRGTTRRQDVVGAKSLEAGNGQDPSAAPAPNEGIAHGEGPLGHGGDG